jgi:hypothetical protein
VEEELATSLLEIAKRETKYMGYAWVEEYAVTEIRKNIVK